jgi:hypothetical protein
MVFRRFLASEDPIMKTATATMKSGLTAFGLGSAWTILSMLHRGGMDGIYRGFPFAFASAYQGDLVTSYQDPPTIWQFLGFGPVIADLVIWILLAAFCLRFVKGTASALIGVAAIQCVIGFFEWWKWGDYFGWANWLIAVLPASIYFLLGIYARRSRLPAAGIGAGLCASIVAYQIYHNADEVISSLIFQIPIAVLLLLGVWFALRKEIGRTTSDGGQQFRASRHA